MPETAAIVTMKAIGRRPVSIDGTLFMPAAALLLVEVLGLRRAEEPGVVEVVAAEVGVDGLVDELLRGGRAGGEAEEDEGEGERARHGSQSKRVRGRARAGRRWRGRAVVQPVPQSHRGAGRRRDAGCRC